MSEDQSIRIRGVQEIQRALFAYNARLGERVNRLAMRKGANYFLKIARQAAPQSQHGSKEKVGGGYIRFSPGRIKRAMGVRNSKINQIRKNGKTGVYFLLFPGKKRSDPKGAWYGKFQEIGWNTGKKSEGAEVLTSRFSNQGRRRIALDRRFRERTYRQRGGGTDIAGKHFILDSFRANAPAALDLMIEASEIALYHLGTELNLNTRRT